MSHELIPTAWYLTKRNPNSRPRQADLKRAVSTAYYAMFQALAQDCADRFIGVGQQRSRPAWNQVYRALDHGPAKKAFEQAPKLGFPSGIVTFGNVFNALQEFRHQADYHPDRKFTRAEVVIIVAGANGAIRRLRSEPNPDRKALAALLLVKKRN